MRRSLLLSIAWLAPGCDTVWRLDHVYDDAGSRDGAALDARDDAACGFGPRVRLHTGADNFDPWLSEDGLELFYVRDLVGDGNFDIWHATRANTIAPFDMSSRVDELSTSSADTDPALTEDRLLIMFKSNRSGTERAWQATRASPDVPFNTPTLVAGIAAAVTGLDMSPDGLRVYYNDGPALATATRPSRDGAFGPPQPIAPDYLDFPSVSTDGLQVYYNAGGVARRTRASTSDLFDSTIEPIDLGALDPDISADGQHLVVSAGGALYVRTLCE